MVYHATTLDPHLNEGGSLDNEPVLYGPCREAPQIAYRAHRGRQLYPWGQCDRQVVLKAGENGSSRVFN